MAIGAPLPALFVMMYAPIQDAASEAKLKHRTLNANIAGIASCASMSTPVVVHSFRCILVQQDQVSMGKG